MKPLTVLIIVLLIVLLGEWIASLIADNGAAFIGLGLTIFSAMLIYSFITAKKVKP